MERYSIYYIILAFTLFSCSEDTVINEEQEQLIPFSYEFSKFRFVHDLTNASIPYNFFEPEQLPNSNEKFPLIIALQGIEYFSNNEDVFLTDEITGYFALAWIEEQNQLQNPAYVVAPNIYRELWLNEGYPNWSSQNSIDFVEKLLDYLLTIYPSIDENRIYLTGHSAGGVGSWYIGTQLRNKIAAIVPLSPAFDSSSSDYDELQININNGDLNELPIWCFIHRVDADDADGSRLLFQDFQNSGQNPVYTHWLDQFHYNLTTTQINSEISMNKKHFYTEYNYSCSTDCHFAMMKALREPFLMDWLFTQRKN